MKKDVKEEFLSAYTLYSDDLFRYCFFKTGDRELAKDMLQDIFMKAWTYASSGKKIEKYKPFLYRLGTNIIIDWYRKKKTISLDSLEEAGFEPKDTNSDTALTAEFEQALAVLAKLPKHEQDLIYFRYVEDFSPKAIAEMLGEKENSVSVGLHRAVKHWRDLIT